MTICESCGQHIPEGVLRCPSCGAALPASTNPTSTGRSGLQPENGKATSTWHGDLAGFEEYIPPLHAASDRPYRISASSPSQQDEAGPPLDTDTPSDESDTAYLPPMTFYTTRTYTGTFPAPLLVEILLSLFMGIFGVGWLMIGEVTTGVLLLVGSFLLYLPLVVVSFILAITSVGLSLVCTGPLAIGAVCLNAFFLHNRIKRKAAKAAEGRGDQSSQKDLGDHPGSL